MSVNAHFGIEQSRRDDLEAVGYLMVYFMKSGKLPWMGLKIDGIRERYKMIGHKKEEISTAKLCAELPREIATYLRYVKGLKFTDTPDYNYLRNLFRSCLISRRLKEDDVFDWMDLQSLRPSPMSRASRNSGPTDKPDIVLQEAYTPPKPKIIIFNSPTKTIHGSNLNRHLSKSVGNIQSSSGLNCSPMVSESASYYDEESKSNKVLQLN